MPSPPLRPLLDNGRYFEGPRWHGDRLWLVDCMTRTVLTVNVSSKSETVCRVDGDVPCGLGFLPTGELIIVSMRRRALLKFADGKLSTYADLSHLAKGTIDDMIVDGEGRAYVGDLGFDLPPPPERGADGRLILVNPDGSARVVADGLRFPNGIAVSDDGTRLVVAEMEGRCLTEFAIRPDGSLDFRRRFGDFAEPDGICLDREGAVWAALFAEDCFLRVDGTGRILQRIATPGRRAIACTLGGSDRRSLFCLSAETTYQDLGRGKSHARVDVVEVEVPGAGYP
jgi:sugar lactone lactonase YvrE